LLAEISELPPAILARPERHVPSDTKLGPTEALAQD
jgi:hypothetical protein